MSELKSSWNVILSFHINLKKLITQKIQHFQTQNVIFNIIPNIQYLV